MVLFFKEVLLVDIMERLSFFPALYNVTENPKVGMWLIYITIVALSIVVYKLGFAQKLPLENQL